MGDYEKITLVDVMDERGALWSVPVSRIRKVRHISTDKRWFDRVYIDGDEVFTCVHRGKRAPIGMCLHYVAPYKQ